MCSSDLAVSEIKKAGYKTVESYSPFPIHGMDKAMGLKESKMGWIVLGGGVTGLSLGFGLQTWVSTAAYKMTISGKPFFSYQAFVPVTFELMVLLAAFGAFFGMFIMNNLPKQHHPLFNSENFKTVTSHGFFISIEENDVQFHENKTVDFLKKLGGKNVEIIEN